MVERFGPYELHSLVGRGGMGEVYRAVDTRKSRGVVALKRLPAGTAEDQGFHRRFLREAELAARLRDPHVIPIHDYGEIEGRPYLEMRLVDGVDLASVLARQGAMPLDRVLGLITQIAGALDAAHREGLVHRDVKPQNVLLHRSDSADDDREFVYLIDFGIAANLLSSRRSSSMVSGTVAYMAPERFTTGGDHRVDVYALGCLLYEMLTGELPFTGDFMQLMAAHAGTEPPAPSARCAGLPRHVDDVVRRAMAKDPDHRFPTTGALAAAARQAPPRPPNRAPALPPSGVPRHGLPEQRHVPTRAAPGRYAGLSQAAPAGSPAIRTVGDREGRWFHHVAYSPDGDVVAAAFRTGGLALLDASTCAVVHEIEDERVFTAAAFSPEGDLLAVGTDQGSTGDVVLWDTEDWSMFGRAARHGGKITSLAFSEDGRYLASAGVDHYAVVWDVDKDRRVMRGLHVLPVEDVAFSPDGQWLATAAGNVGVFDATVRARWARPSWRCLTGGVRYVSFSPSGARLVDAGTHHYAVVHEVPTGRRIRSIPVGAEARGLAHVPGTGRLLIAGAHGQLTTWELDDGGPISALDLAVEIDAISLHPSGSTVAVVTADGTIRFVGLDLQR